ncbi:MAG: SIS domain-containing protein [Kiritimatiellae bacterium]|nr:SIS domain-containing protein [Kiritimatiellia bacterium]
MSEQSLRLYAEALSSSLIQSDFAALDRIGNLLLSAKKDGRTIFLIGNGGSSATASHVTNDLVKGCRVGDCSGFRAVCLNDSSTLLTCLANDFSYADVFAILLETYARPGDILIAFSGSGNSPNVLRAIEKAREMGMTCIGFGGRDGGKMKPLCDICLIAPTDSMEMLEDLHLVYWHDLVCSLREALGGIAGSC